MKRYFFIQLHIGKEMGGKTTYQYLCVKTNSQMVCFQWCRQSMRSQISIRYRSIDSKLGSCTAERLYCDARGETTIAAADSLNLSPRAKRKLYGDVYHLPY